MSVDDVLDQDPDQDDQGQGQGIDWSSIPGFGLAAQKIFGVGFHFLRKSSAMPAGTDIEDCRAAAYEGFLAAASGTNIETVEQAEKFLRPAVRSMKQFAISLLDYRPAPRAEETVFYCEPRRSYAEDFDKDFGTVDLVSAIIEPPPQFSSPEIYSAVLNHTALLQNQNVEAALSNNAEFDLATRRRLAAGSIEAEISGSAARVFLGCSEQSLLNYAAAGKIRRTITGTGPGCESLYDLADVVYQKMLQDKYCEKATIKRCGESAVRYAIDQVVNHPGSPCRNSITGTDIDYNDLLLFVRELLEHGHYVDFDDVLLRVFDRYDNEMFSVFYKMIWDNDWMLCRAINAQDQKAIEFFTADRAALTESLHQFVASVEQFTGKQFNHEVYENENEVRGDYEINRH